MPSNNSIDDKELYFATALANPKVRTAVRGHLQNMEWASKFATRISEYFLGLGDMHPYDQMGLHGHLVHEFFDTEINQVLHRCLEHVRSYREDATGLRANSILQQFQKFYNRKVITKIITEFRDNPERLVEEIERVQRMKFASLPIDTLGELDVDKVISEDLGDIQYIPTSFKCVRESCGTPYEGDKTEEHGKIEGGYSTGQVVMVCAAPGNGKTLFLAHEVVRMMEENKKIEDEKKKIRVYWIALGDMNRLDFIIRLSAIWLGKSFNEVKVNPKLYFNDEVREAMKYVKISVVPAAFVDIYGVKYFIENTVVDPTFDPQVVIIDYDANLLSNRESMYQTGEEVYNVASSISRPIGKPGRLVFMASQPKIEYWNQCPMPKEAAAESSRKQAIIDMMITIARDPSSARDRRVGKMMVAKNRRGIEGSIGLYSLMDGRFTTIDENEYATSLESSSGSTNSSGSRKNTKRYNNIRAFGTS